MKFPYIPIDQLLAEVESQFKMYNRQGKYNEDDAYSYAIEAAREIGLNNYDESTVGIPIHGHIGALPKEFYLTKEVWAATICDPVITSKAIREPFAIDANLTIPVEKNHLLHPGDSATVRLCKDKQTPFLSAGTPSYTMKVPPGVIRTNYKQGLVMLNFYHLSKDERGVICCQDEINTTKAIKAYVITSMLKEDYIMQKIPRYIYQDIKEEYEVHLDLAKAIYKFVDPSAMNYHAAKVQNRYNNFKLK